MAIQRSINFVFFRLYSIKKTTRTIDFTTFTLFVLPSLRSGLMVNGSEIGRLLAPIVC